MNAAANVLSNPRHAANTSWQRVGLFGRVKRESYRKAIAQIIRSVKAAEKLSNEQLGEELGVSDQTIANAENEAGNLDAVTLLNIALIYGEDAIEPVRQLYLCAPAEEPTAAEREKAVEG